MEKSGLKNNSLLGNQAFQEIVMPMVPAFEALELFLSEQVNSFEPEVRPLVEYCFGHSGKKLRPLLVFSMGIEPGEAVRPEIVKAAAIVELVHLATLVHDDILDKAETRHRTETVVSKFGSHVAVLTGDALFAHALHLAASFPDVEVCRSVSLSTRQVCSGEIAQTFARGGELPGLQDYYRMIDLKTAELFNVSAFLGGYLNGYSPEQCEAARSFARHLGIAYQIYDDAADIFADESVAGKTLGTDLATGKFTLPVLLWLGQLDAPRRQAVLHELNKHPGSSKVNVRKELLQANMLDATGRAFFEEITKAESAISRIPGELRKENLRQLAGFVEKAWNKFTIQ